MTGAQHQTLARTSSGRSTCSGAPHASAPRSKPSRPHVAVGVQDRERMLAAAVRQQAGRLLAARRNVDVMNEALIAARRMRELLDSRVTEGETPKLDANIAAVEAGRIEADLAIAQADADAAAIELKALVGLRPTDALNLRDSLEALVRANPSCHGRGPGRRPIASRGRTSGRRPRASRSRMPASKRRAGRDRPT